MQSIDHVSRNWGINKPDCVSRCVTLQFACVTASAGLAAGAVGERESLRAGEETGSLQSTKMIPFCGFPSSAVSYSRSCSLAALESTYGVDTSYTKDKTNRSHNSPHDRTTALGRQRACSAASWPN